MELAGQPRPTFAVNLFKDGFSFDGLAFDGQEIQYLWRFAVGEVP